MFHKLQQLLKEKGMTKAELSRKSGVALSFINYIESGEKSPTIRTLQKLASALGVPVRDLLDDELETKVNCGLDATGTE